MKEINKQSVKIWIIYVNTIISGYILIGRINFDEVNKKCHFRDIYVQIETNYFLQVSTRASRASIPSREATTYEPKLISTELR